MIAGLSVLTGATNDMKLAWCSLVTKSSIESVLGTTVDKNSAMLISLAVPVLTSFAAVGLSPLNTPIAALAERSANRTSLIVISSVTA